MIARELAKKIDKKSLKEELIEKARKEKGADLEELRDLLKSSWLKGNLEYLTIYLELNLKTNMGES